MPILNHRFLLLFWCSILFAFGGVSIWLKPQALYKEDLHLKDVAEIKGGASYLGEILLTPKEYSDFLISKEDIQKALKRGYIDPRSFRFYGGETKLLIPLRKLDRDFLKNLIRHFIENRYKNVKVASIGLSSWKNLDQKGFGSLKFFIKSESFTHIYLNVFIKKNKILKKIPVTVKIERFKNIAVAKRDIPKGKVIGPEDIEYKKKRLFNSLQARWNEQLEGLVAKRTIRAGQIIRPSMVIPNYMVKKRHTVKIIYQNGPIHIELLGFALQNGNKGDLIQVKNLSSNKVIVCKVLSNGVVQFVR